MDATQKAASLIWIFPSNHAKLLKINGREMRFKT